MSVVGCFLLQFEWKNIFLPTSKISISFLVWFSRYLIILQFFSNPNLWYSSILSYIYPLFLAADSSVMEETLSWSPLVAIISDDIWLYSILWCRYWQEMPERWALFGLNGWIMMILHWRPKRWLAWFQKSWKGNGVMTSIQIVQIMIRMPTRRDQRMAFLMGM